MKNDSGEKTMWRRLKQSNVNSYKIKTIFTTCNEFSITGTAKCLYRNHKQEFKLLQQNVSGKFIVFLESLSMIIYLIYKIYCMKCT